ncbi:MAG: type II toxin-antitoxin system Phd/YefM family antitoxin [Microbacteriaceae bacterium]
MSRGVTVATMSARQFNQDLATAKRDAANEPVFITDRGEPKFVLLSIEQYEALKRPTRNLHEILRMENGDDIDFEVGYDHDSWRYRVREVNLDD